ncbi:MAG: Somatomedin domain, partial [Pseudomonadota bacterium]
MLRSKDQSGIGMRAGAMRWGVVLGLWAWSLSGCADATGAGGGLAAPTTADTEAVAAAAAGADGQGAADGNGQDAAGTDAGAADAGERAGAPDIGSTADGEQADEAVDDGDGPVAPSSCVGRCGKFSEAAACQCDAKCSAYADCCDDFGAVCATGVAPGGSCAESCGGQAGVGACW